MFLNYETRVQPKIKMHQVFVNGKELRARHTILFFREQLIQIQIAKTGMC